MFSCQELIEEFSDTASFIITQFSLKASIKHRKVKGRSAAKFEINQLHFIDTFQKNHHRNLNEDKKNIIMESRVFLKGNRCGTIKGRTVVGGKKQRCFISKEYSCLTTVATKAVIVYCIIDAEEERGIAVINIPNVFIQT